MSLHIIPDRYILIGMDTATSNRKGHMILQIELTDTEYHGLMHALKHATYAIRPQVNDTDQLELLHLMTLLAEAAAPEEQR